MYSVIDHSSVYCCMIFRNSCTEVKRHVLNRTVANIDINTCKGCNEGFCILCAYLENYSCKNLIQFRSISLGMFQCTESYPKA